MYSKKLASAIAVGDGLFIEPFAGQVVVDVITPINENNICFWVIACTGKVHPLYLHPSDLVDCYSSALVANS
ncbi:MAG TPA: hypothetical protein VIL78_00730 [Hanamia sp.]